MEPAKLRDILIFIVTFLLAAWLAGTNLVAAICVLLLGVLAALRYTSDLVRDLYKHNPRAFGALEMLLAFVALFDMFT